MAKEKVIITNANELEAYDEEPDEGDEWEKLKQELMSREERAIPIPYAFVLGAVNIIGVLYIKDPVKDSYTQGAFAGVVFGTYKINRKKPEACADNLLVKVCIRFDFGKTRLQGKLCTRKWNGKWRCGKWKTIIDF